MVAQRAGTNVSLEDVLDLQDRMMALELALRGKFNEELATLREERTRLETLQGIAATVEEAARLKGEADRYAQEIKAKADEVIHTAEEVTRQCTAERAKIDQDRQQLIAEQDALQERKRAAAIEFSGDRKQLILDRADIDRLAVELRTAQAALERREAELSKRERAFEQRLAAAREASTL